MRILIDTHTWLWWLMTPERLNQQALALMADRDNTILLSAASALEVVIKYSAGKLELPVPPAEFIPSRMIRDGIDGLALEHRHALQVTHLPLHHRDPFDRVIIAQAQIEGTPILTADRQFAAYDVALIQAG